MTVPNSNSFTNTNPHPAPTPTPAPLPNSPAEASAASYTVYHPVIPPTNHSAAFIKKHKLVIATGAATVTSGAAGVTAFLECKKYNQSEIQILTNVYDKCRQDNSFTNEDAIYHLTINNFPDEKIFEVLRASF